MDLVLDGRPALPFLAAAARIDLGNTPNEHIRSQNAYKTATTKNPNKSISRSSSETRKGVRSGPVADAKEATNRQTDKPVALK